MSSNCCHSILTKAFSCVDHAAFYADPVLDCVPVVSTVTNGVHLVEKLALKTFLSCGCLKKTTLNKSLAYNSIHHKSVGRCILLMIPIVGQGIVGFYTAVTWSKFCEKRQYLKDLANPTRKPHVELHETRNAIKKLETKVNGVVKSKEIFDINASFQKRLQNFQNDLNNTYSNMPDSNLVKNIKTGQNLIHNEAESRSIKKINKKKSKCQNKLNDIKNKLDTITNIINDTSEKTTTKINGIKKKINKLEEKLNGVNFPEHAISSDEE